MERVEILNMQLEEFLQRRKEAFGSVKTCEDDFRDFQISEIRKKLKDISEKREVAIREEQRTNEEKINWQNSPEHPDNVRSKKLEETKNIIEVLSKMKELNIISKEQLEMLEQSSDFVKYSRNVEDRVIEPMPSDIREELKAYYTEQEEQSRKSK